MDPPFEILKREEKVSSGEGFLIERNANFYNIKREEKVERGEVENASEEGIISL